MIAPAPRRNSAAAPPARTRRPHLGTAFTLLEAVLALAILSAVMAATLGIRAQALAAATRLAAHNNDARAADAIFNMAFEGMIPDPLVDPESQTRLWQGQHLGKPFELRAVAVELPSAIPEQDRARLSDRIIMFRYTLTYQGAVTQCLWHR